MEARRWVVLGVRSLKAELLEDALRGRILRVVPGEDGLDAEHVEGMRTAARAASVAKPWPQYSCRRRKPSSKTPDSKGPGRKPQQPTNAALALRKMGP